METQNSPTNGKRGGDSEIDDLLHRLKDGERIDFDGLAPYSKKEAATVLIAANRARYSIDNGSLYLVLNSPSLLKRILTLGIST